jgi:3D-(3,5/4)-trihydroxycyclohexane-1,2-dione acylhydrolase (decyclizing)
MTNAAMTTERAKRAKAIAESGGLEQAIASGRLPRCQDMTLSEAVVLGLLCQNVRNFLCVLGHGSTEVGEVLRIYAAEELVKVRGVRSEIEASHAAAALRWVTGEKAAVITSIGPGALQALAASLAPASDRLGVWYLFGDETTHDEGPNMQQIPKREQDLFLRLCATMGEAYNLHSPEAVGAALRRGLVRTDHPHNAGPFYLLLPLNTQPGILRNFNLDELPVGDVPGLGAAPDENAYLSAIDAIRNAEKIVVKAGGGARDAGPELAEFLELADAVAVTSPLVSGVIPYNLPRNMTVGGSKGSISGNYAMEQADLLVAIGTRFVCQSDSSRTGYPNAKRVININAEVHDATHYAKTIAMLGDAKATLQKLNAALRATVVGKSAESPWFRACLAKKKEWDGFKAMRYAQPTLFDEMWKKDVLTQPAAVKAVSDWGRKNDAVLFFDAGDVQANGFQVVEDDRLGRAFTETGASYMGFAVCSLLATAIASRAFYGVAMTGDGSFMMNPQILIDGVEHGAKGCVVLFDNRRMGAISSLQAAQYNADFATNDSVEVDYVALAAAVKGVNALFGGRSIPELLVALENARSYDGLSLIHVPVYFGHHELGGLGAHGRWNVGNWVEATQALRHRIGL